MTTQTHTEADYECKHCGETTDELTAKECEESSMGHHAWNHVNPSETGGTGATVKDSTEDETEENDDWKTMSAEECKRQDGLEQVEGVVYEQTDDNDNEDHWNPKGDSCPSCGSGEENQDVTARPAQNTDVELSLPDRVLECSACGVEWED